jgi:hypothetical protein
MEKELTMSIQEIAENQLDVTMEKQEDKCLI